MTISLWDTLYELNYFNILFCTVMSQWKRVKPYLKLHVAVNISAIQKMISIQNVNTYTTTIHTFVLGLLKWKPKIWNHLWQFLGMLCTLYRVFQYRHKKIKFFFHREIMLFHRNYWSDSIHFYSILFFGYYFSKN